MHRLLSQGAASSSNMQKCPSRSQFLAFSDFPCSDRLAPGWCRFRGSRWGSLPRPSSPTPSVGAVGAAPFAVWAGGKGDVCGDTGTPSDFNRVSRRDPGARSSADRPHLPAFPRRPFSPFPFFFFSVVPFFFSSSFFPTPTLSSPEPQGRRSPFRRAITDVWEVMLRGGPLPVLRRLSPVCCTSLGTGETLDGSYGGFWLAAHPPALAHRRPWAAPRRPSPLSKEGSKPKAWTPLSYPPPHLLGGHLPSRDPISCTAGISPSEADSSWTFRRPETVSKAFKTSSRPGQKS
ncbi:uncharacterized protein LOC128850367 isoform X2 [Cuculus canorus]|uniref:uncharacterized protein LOC128850367 isoform X2 n=1 Tax=Cuculus canorus TaxID=55661 RepID=UPI0023AAE8F0|nr:uncharacterized protein LOC128850367 isoform X2 [Cuculus canorus]